MMAEGTDFLVILSAASIRADWVLAEVRLARERKAKDSTFTLLPLPVGKLDVYAEKGFIETLQAVPYREDFLTQLEAVVEAVGTACARSALSSG